MSDAAGGSAEPPRHSPVQLLAHVARRVGASLDLRETLDAVAAAVVEALDFETAVVNLLVEDGDLETVAVAGSDEAQRTLLGYRWKRELCEALFAAAEVSGNVYFVPGRAMLALTEAHPDLRVWVPDMGVSDAGDAWHPMDACFAAMTGSSGELLGVLSVDVPRDGRRPGVEQRELLGAFAVHAALALEHASMHSRLRSVERELRHQATHDTLTGLPNRAHMQAQLETALSSRGPLFPCVAFVFCDLDDFKQVNDSYGHAVGDAVLVEVARVLRTAIRPTDVVGRLGGDEFVVLCRPVLTGDEAAAIAQRIAAALALPLTVGGHTLVPSASIGVTVSRPGVDADALMAEADRALYAAKALGGGRWELFEAHMGEAASA